MCAQTILDKFKKREKKGDAREAVADLEARLAEVAAQLAEAAGKPAAAQDEAKPNVKPDVSGVHHCNCARQRQCDDAQRGQRGAVARIDSQNPSEQRSGVGYLPPGLIESKPRRKLWSKTWSLRGPRISSTLMDVVV